MPLMRVLPVVAMVLCGSLYAQEKVDLVAAKAKFEAAGLKVSSAGLSLPEETEFTKLQKDLVTQKKNLVGSDRELQAAEVELAQVKQTIIGLKAKHVELSAAMGIGGADVRTTNQIIGTLNAIGGQIDLLIGQQERSTEKIKAARAKNGEAREAFVQHVMSMRVLADKISRKWETLAADAELQKLVTDVNQAANKRLALKAPSSFVTGEKQLQALEEKVLTETIPLRDDRGSLFVSVVFNGKHTQEMVLDSGATNISLPFTMAKAMGIEIGSADQKVMVGLADGSQVSGVLKTIPSVRVGKFQVENVECIILGPEAIAAPPLLGMSFLGNFQFEVNSQKAELKMVKVDSGDEKPKKK